MIKVCLVGLGKTGKEVAKLLLEQPDIKLTSAICSPGSSKAGKDLGEVIGCSKTGIIVGTSDNLEEMMFNNKPDVVIDFSSPEATMKNASKFSKMRASIVIATTGFSSADMEKLHKLTHKYRNGIVYAPNITLGVNVLMLLANVASNILNNYDFQITEIHHKNKKDAPSGTAFKIANEIKRGLISSGAYSKEPTIPINAIRAGGVVGKHKVLIVGEEDKIEISHESFSRRVFGEGALYAVRFVYKKSGFFEMKDVLNMDKVFRNYLGEESENSPTANC